MVFPLYDDNPFRRAKPAYVTWSLIAPNALIFLCLLGADEQTQNHIRISFGVSPFLLFNGTSLGFYIPRELSLITSCFLHADFGQILGNMIYLWVFGDDIEDALGSFRFLLFYLLCGIAGALAYVALDVTSPIPLIGASGAVSGILAAYLMLRPCAKVSVFVIQTVVRIRAYWLIGGWILLQLYLLATNTQDGVGYIAHAGGAVTGALLFWAIRRKGVVFFDCIEQPREMGASSRKESTTW